ncbi:la protein homolog [Ctenocephalides felis]|uniref:la protein homolog n=1 Tax=Ctenocephalides felis TaxID=7515 RepID=UPI000E6E3096|nr:la protein homolog [Ctenocephalides felis]
MGEELDVSKDENNISPITDANNGEKNVLLHQKVIEQLEYYFGDYNYPKDKFLQEQILLDDGWIPISTLMSFKKLSAIIQSDKNVLVEAFGNYKNDLLEISKDNLKIRRSPDKPAPKLTEDYIKEVLNRTVYVKGFFAATKFDEIKDFFSSYQTVENIEQRFFKDIVKSTRIFKGSVFATFSTRQQAISFLGHNSMYFKNRLIIRMWKEEYLEVKRIESLKKKMFETASSNKLQIKIPTGAMFAIENFTSVANRFDIKNALSKFGLDVAFVDFRDDGSSVWIRLHKENEAKEFINKMKGLLNILGQNVNIRLIEGEEETDYLNKVKGIMQNSNSLNKTKTNQQNKKRQNDNKSKQNNKRQKVE